MYARSIRMTEGGIFMLQALLDNSILLLFLAIIIPLVLFGFVGTYFQDKEEKLYNERIIRLFLDRKQASEEG